MSHQQQWSRKKQIHTDVSQALLLLEDEGVCALHVTLVYEQTDTTEILNLHSGMYTKLHKINSSTNDDDDLDLALYVKDRFGLSDAAYHELSMVCDKLPCSWKLKHLAKCINSKHQIKPCWGTVISLFQA